MKKILYICDQSPFEYSYGAQQRSSLLLDALCEKGNVNVVCFISEPTSLPILKDNCTIEYFGKLHVKEYPKITSRIKKVLNILYSFSPYSLYNINKEANTLVRNLLNHNKYDYIVVRYIRNAFACGLIKEERLIVDVDDLPEQSIMSYAESTELSKFKYLQYSFYSLRAKYHTNRFLKNIHHSFFSNRIQCKWQNSSYLPNIPFPKFKKGQNGENLRDAEVGLNVLFVGYMYHMPNLEGVQHFIENCWLRVKEAFPEAVFKIVGKGISSEQKELWEKYNGVNVLGFVEDVFSVYEICKVVVVPIFYGAGTNIKVLEAMSMKKATVVSDYTAKAFKSELIDNENILIARDDFEFTNKVIQLLRDDQLNKSIANNAVKVIEENYAYSIFKNSVHKFIL